MEKKLKNFLLKYKNIFIIIFLSNKVFSEDRNEINLLVTNAKTNLINITYYPFISEIIVNGNPANTESYTNLLTKSQNSVTIKFKILLTTCITMFSNLNNILYVDLFNFDASKVKNMHQMFRGCTSLKSLNISKLDTSSVTNMYGMFDNCKALLSINLNNLNLSSVKDMGNMFYSCTSLSSLNINDLDVPSVTSMSYLFYSCTSMISIDINNLNAPSLRNVSYLFYQCTKTNSLNIKNIKTKSLQDMSYMFFQCSSLKFIDLNKLDTSNVIDMKGIFYKCNSLTSINLTALNTSSVINMENMFYMCQKLLSLDLSNFNTSSVKNMSLMFYDCNSLDSLNLSNFNTKSVVNMNQMFKSCKKLKSLIIDNFITSSVTDMYTMFYDCRSLISLNLCSFIINTDNINSMFSYSYSNLELCLDVNKNYDSKFISLASNYKINCTDICVNLKFKKFIKEENICVDDCPSTKKYKYDYNNICHKKCPLDPDLCALYDEIINVENDLIDTTIIKIDESTYVTPILKNSTDTIEKKDTISKTNSLIDKTVIKIDIPLDNTIIIVDNVSNNPLEIKNELEHTKNDEDDNSNKINKNKLLKIIIFIISVLVVLAVIIVIIVCCCKCKNGKKIEEINKPDETHVISEDNEKTCRFQNEIKIIFDTPQGKFTIYINPKETIKKAIDMFYRKRKTRKKKLLFLLNSVNLNLEENQNKKVEDFINTRFFDGQLVIIATDI